MCIQALPFVLAKPREPQPSSAKLSQPIITIAIVAHSFDALARQPLLIQL